MKAADLDLDLGFADHAMAPVTIEERVMGVCSFFFSCGAEAQGVIEK